MATKVNVNGKLVTRPGVYTLIKSGIQNAPARLDYGVVTIIDDGLGAGWGGGKGKEALTFERIQDFRDFVKGGPLWDLALPLWKPVPAQNNIIGISQLILIQARDTTPATITVTLDNGEIVLTTKDQGLNANGVEVSSELKRGYAATLKAGSTAENAGTRASGSVTITGIGADGDTIDVKVSGVTISGVVAKTVTESTPALLATKIATAITAAVGTNGGYTATASLGVITILGPLALGSTINTISPTATIVGTITATFTAFTGGVTPVVGTYVMKLWHGSYKGLDSLNNLPYEGVTEANAKPILLAQSPEVTTITELKDWLEKDSGITTGFTSVVTGTGDLVVGDITSANVLAVGGTETYSNEALVTSRNVAKGVNTNFFLGLKSGSDADHANNQAILSDIILASKYEKFLVVGAGETAAELETISVPVAELYDTDKVIVVHGNGLTTLRSNTFKKRSSLWRAADDLGRLCGLTPQTPLTLKKTGVDAEANPLDEVQQERALAKGVLCHYTDDELGYNVILQGINSLQENEFLVNDDGTSHSIAVKRITAQLNKEVAIFLKKKFFGNDNVGPNRNTVTEADLVAATEGYLQKRTASTNQDDLIIRFQNITAVVDQDTYKVNYEFVPNFEVNKFIITGIILEK